MPDLETVGTWQGRALLDRDSGRIGTIDAICLDDRTGQPGWALVNTGLFGTRSTTEHVRQAVPLRRERVRLGEDTKGGRRERRRRG
jgi:PRC-barrel domain